MRIDHANPRGTFVTAHAGRESRHDVADRVEPSIWQYDYPVLRSLRDDVEGCRHRTKVGRDFQRSGIFHRPANQGARKNPGFTVSFVGGELVTLPEGLATTTV